MSYRYNHSLDKMIGHDYPGVYGNGFVQHELDELELGARVAMALDEPEQWWWELIGNKLLEKYEADYPRDSNDNSMDHFASEHL